MCRVCCLHIWGAVIVVQLFVGEHELKYVLRVLAMSPSVVTIWPVGVLGGPTLSVIILFSLMEKRTTSFHS